MSRQDYERSPRQRLEWFGGRQEYEHATSDTEGASTVDGRIIETQPRLTLSAGTVNTLAFPAGIVRGETCSIARFIGHLSIYDVDRRQQNVSFEVGAGLIKASVEDAYIEDPSAFVEPAPTPDALDDLRASWLWHRQVVWNPQSAGANYTVFSVDLDVDTTNSRIFESNDVLQLSTEIRTRVNSGAAVVVTARCTFLWRCLLRLD